MCTSRIQFIGPASEFGRNESNAHTNTSAYTCIWEKQYNRLIDLRNVFPSSLPHVIRNAENGAVWECVCMDAKRWETYIQLEHLTLGSFFPLCFLSEIERHVSSCRWCVQIFRFIPFTSAVSFSFITLWSSDSYSFRVEFVLLLFCIFASLRFSSVHFMFSHYNWTHLTVKTVGSNTHAHK